MMYERGRVRRASQTAYYDLRDWQRTLAEEDDAAT